MGIFSRFSDIVNSNINALLDKAEDPEKMLKQMVIEMEESVNKATLAIANSMAHEKSLQRKIEKAERSKKAAAEETLEQLISCQDLNQAIDA